MAEIVSGALIVKASDPDKRFPCIKGVAPLCAHKINVLAVPLDRSQFEAVPIRTLFDPPSVVEPTCCPMTTLFENVVRFVLVAAL